MSRYVIFALAALAACSGPDDKGESGETGGTTPTECVDGVYDGPVVIVEYSASCDATDNLRYFVETEGWTSNGRVFSQETSNNNAWSDEHELISYEFDACQFWDRLEAVVTTGAAVADATPGQSTVFTCAAHIDDPNVMSYAAQVDDIDGNPADCVAWGEDPQGMIDNTASAPDGRANDPSWDLSVCEIGVAAR